MRKHSEHSKSEMSMGGPASCNLHWTSKSLPEGRILAFMIIIEHVGAVEAVAVVKEGGADGPPSWDTTSAGREGVVAFVWDM